MALIRSPLSGWIGGKMQLSQAIVPLIPVHECYVEPFAGAAKPGRDAGRPRRSKKGLRRPLSLASQEAMRATAGAARPAVIDVLSAPVFWGGSRPSRGLNQRY